MKTTTTKILSTLVALSLGACAVDQADDATDEDYTNEGRLSANGVTPTNVYNAGQLPLVATTAAKNAITTAAGFAVTQYLIQCAIPSGSTMQAYFTPPSGGSMNVAGAFGLAPNWGTTPLTTWEQENMSACILARVNESGTIVTISMRGDTQAFQTTGAELSTYVKQEGAYFGNLFSSAYTHFSCKGSADPATLPATRVCELDGHCGMTWAGNCDSICIDDGNGTLGSCTVGGVLYDNPVSVFDL